MPNPAVLTWRTPVAAVGGGAPLIPIATRTSPADTATYTWAGVPIGTPTPNRTIIVVVAARYATAALTSVTLNGAPAALDSTDAGGGGAAVGIARSASSTGTAADISVTLSATQRRAAIAVYAIDAPLTVNNSIAGWAPGTAPVVISGTKTGDFTVAVFDRRKAHDEEGESFTGVDIDWWHNLENEAFPHFGHSTTPGPFEARWDTNTLLGEVAYSVVSYTAGA